LPYREIQTLPRCRRAFSLSAPWGTIVTSFQAPTGSPINPRQPQSKSKARRIAEPSSILEAIIYEFDHFVLKVYQAILVLPPIIDTVVFGRNRAHDHSDAGRRKLVVEYPPHAARRKDVDWDNYALGATGLCPRENRTRFFIGARDLIAEFDNISQRYTVFLEHLSIKIGIARKEVQCFPPAWAHESVRNENLMRETTLVQISRSHRPHIEAATEHRDRISLIEII
jgi:hypothetical protein